MKYLQDTADGVFGLELTQNSTLRGTNGWERKEVDARQIAIPERSTRREPAAGRDVVLTLDLYIQQVAERELAKAVQESRAAAGVCVVMDPRTGEVLALAVNPAWDANDPSTRQGDLVIRAISYVYEPGSTFKLLATLGALEDGKAQDGQQITYCSGSLSVGRGRPIGEAHNAHGAVDPCRLLEQSCNIGAAVLALRLGPDRFLHWCKALGFSTRTGIELAGEARGRLNSEELHTRPTLARMGFGQSLNVTPLQMVAAYATVANDGEWVQPHLVKGYMEEDGRVREVTAPRRRVCSPDTARLLRGYLEQVVVGEHGTGDLARIPGYRVAGKTGTAQKVVAGTRGYSGYVGSFVGFMPVEEPRLAIVTVIDEPKGSHYGGVIAAPVVREVGRSALQYLNIPPSTSASAPAP